MPSLRKKNLTHTEWNGEYLENAAPARNGEAYLGGDAQIQNEMIAPTSVTRLVVLVPAQVITEGRLAKRIWLLASSRRLDILLVARVDDRPQEMASRRQLASLASFLHDAWIKVDTMVLFQHNWVDALSEIVQTGDMIVCHIEQLASTRKLRDRTLNVALGEAFSNPIFLLSGFTEKEKPASFIQLPKQLIAWVGFAVILVVFSLVEVRIDRLVEGTTGQFLLILTLIVEFGLIWFLNALTN